MTGTKTINLVLRNIPGSPLVVHAFAEKAKEEIRAKQRGAARQAGRRSELNEETTEEARMVGRRHPAPLSPKPSNLRLLDGDYQEAWSYQAPEGLEVYLWRPGTIARLLIPARVIRRYALRRWSRRRG